MLMPALLVALLYLLNVHIGWAEVTNTVFSFVGRSKLHGPAFQHLTPRAISDNCRKQRWFFPTCEEPWLEAGLDCACKSDWYIMIID